MNPEHDHSYVHIKKLPLLIVVLIIVAGILGWWLGRSHSSSNSSPQPNPTPAAVSNDSSAKDVKSVVSYTLPNGWKEATCPAVAGAVFVVPTGSVDCNANPSSPIEISIDPGSHTDCNQLQNNTGVKKHVCISLYINGHKSLKASTEYPVSSSYSQDTTINSYYVDTGKGVVKLDYTYTSDNQFQAGFDQLANSLSVKP